MRSILWCQVASAVTRAPTFEAAPPNSVVLIVGSHPVDVPETLGESIVAATASCIAIGTMSEADGRTTFVLGKSSEIDPGNSPVFAGSLITTDHAIRVETVHGNTIASLPVEAETTNVSIWVNDDREPDRIVVGVA